MPKLLFTLTCLIPTLLCAQIAHRTGTVHTADVDLGYETFGTQRAALALIAVNGGPGLSHAYMMQNDLWQRVGANRLVVLYDQRGLGASRHLQARAPQSMAAQVADLEAIRAALSLEKVALLGDSYGGMIVMAYAGEHPERVARLVLSDSAAPSWKTIDHLLPQVFPDVEAQGAEDEKRLAQSDPEAAAQAALLNHMHMIFYSPQKRDAYLAHMGDLGYVPAVGNAVQQATADLDLTPKLAAFKFPVLVITGRYDMNVAPLTAWRIAHAIHGAQLVFFERSGHLPAYEEPEKYHQVLERFLRDSSARSPANP